MKIKAFASRNAKEILRDPLSYIFCLGFPVVMLVIMTIVNESIPPEAGMDIFNIDKLSPGVTVFGLTFVMLFTTILISKDRSTAFLARLCGAPMKSWEFLAGYILPVFVIALLQGVHHGQRVVGVVVLIAHEPAAAAERADKLGIGDVFQLPCVVPAVTLQPPELAALDDVQRDIPHQLVYMAEPLRRAVQAYVVVAAAEQRRQKRRVNVVSKAAAVQLHTQFIHARNGNGQRVVLVVVVLIDLRRSHDLRQTAQRFIRHGERHVGENQHTLRDKLFPARAPDGFAVVVLI